MIGFHGLVQARLGDGRCPSLLQVETGVTAQAAADMLAMGLDVSALITPLSDTPRPINASSLQVTRTDVVLFGVTLALVFPAGFEQFEVARDQVITALQGWRPQGLATAIEYAGGGTLQYDLRAGSGRWLHQLRFRFSEQTTYGVST
jgi:hypothetical protein